MDKLRCLVTLSCRNYSAPASRCAHMMAKGLSINNCAVDFIVGGNCDYPDEDYDPMDDYYYYNCISKNKNIIKADYDHYNEIRKGIIERRWDIILFYSVGVPFLPLILVAKKYNIKIIYVQGDHYVALSGMTWRHKIKLIIINYLDLYLSRNSNLNVLTGTKLLANHILNNAPNVPVYLCFPPINVDLYSGGKTGNCECVKGRDKTIVYCGGVTSLEGVDVLIHSFALLQKKYSDVRLVIAGKLNVYDHALREQIDYEKLTVELKISHKVTFTGFIEQKKVIKLLKSASILVMPKRQHRRNAVAAPIKLTEYMASGRPVIASKVGDLENLFKDGEEIMLCEPGNIADLTDKLTILLESPELAEKIGANGKDYAIANFAYDSWGKKVLNMIK